MEEKIILDESVNVEEIVEEAHEEAISEEIQELPKIQPRKKNDWKEKECRVVGYNMRRKALDVLFDEYGIRIKDADPVNSDFVVLKYKGEIGKPNFEYKLV